MQPRLSGGRHSPFWSCRRARLRRHAAGAIAAVLFAGIWTTPAAGADASVPPGRDAGAPTVVPRVDCVRRGESSDTFWFGYDMSSGTGSVLVRSGFGTLTRKEINAFVEFDDDLVVDETANRSQIEFFVPGRHDHVFAVTVARGHRLSWSLATNSDTAAGVVDLPITVSTDGAPRCGRHTGRQSATIQTDRGEPLIRAAGGRRVLVGGLLVEGSVTFEVTNVVSACSDGGKPLPPAVLWGYDDAVVQASVGLPDEVPRDGFQPLPAKSVVRTDTFASESRYVRTYASSRRLADPQRVWTDPVSGVTSRGIAATMVLADVFGRCKFGRSVVTSAEPMWVAPSGFPTLVVTVTDQASQTTTPLSCTLEPDCPVRVVVGPGGARWR